MREKKKKKLFLFCFRSVFCFLLCDVHVGTSGRTSVVRASKEWREIKVGRN